MGTNERAMSTAERQRSPALAGLFFWLRPRLFRSRPVGQVYNVHSSKLVMEPA